jgi:hypothetical protein
MLLFLWRLLVVGFPRDPNACQHIYGPWVLVSQTDWTHRNPYHPYNVRACTTVFLQKAMCTKCNHAIFESTERER